MKEERGALRVTAVPFSDPGGGSVRMAAEYNIDCIRIKKEKTEQRRRRKCTAHPARRKGDLDAETEPR